MKEQVAHWSSIRTWGTSGITIIDNAVVGGDEVRVVIAPDDFKSLAVARGLGGSLPAKAIQTSGISGHRKLLIESAPFNCSGMSPESAFFVRPYFWGNLFRALLVLPSCPARARTMRNHSVLLTLARRRLRARRSHE